MEQWGVASHGVYKVCKLAGLQDTRVVGHPGGTALCVWGVFAGLCVFTPSPERTSQRRGAFTP